MEASRSVSWGPYSEYSVAQERAMKEQNTGVRGLRIDKRKQGWIVSGVDTASVGPEKLKEE